MENDKRQKSYFYICLLNCTCGPRRNSFFVAKQRTRRQVFRVRDIKKLMGRHEHRDDQSKRNVTPQTPVAIYPLDMFEAIHELTARAFRMNDTKERSNLNPMKVPFNSLVGSMLPYYRRASTTVSPEMLYRESLYRPIGGDSLYPFRKYTTTKRPTSPRPRFRYELQYVHPGRITFPTPGQTKTATTRRPLPHDMPFYRVVEPANPWELSLESDYFDGLMEGQMPRWK